jgi:hypothetical protein
MAIGFIALFLVLFAYLNLSCGIKKSPKPLKKPNVSIKVIGSSVYIIPYEPITKPKGFIYSGRYLYKEVKKGECFKISAPNRKALKFCVESILVQKPKVDIEEDREGVLLKPGGFERYRLYPLEGVPMLEKGKEVKGQLYIEKDFISRCFALTGVKGSAESFPYEFCVSPKTPPKPPKPLNLTLTLLGGRLVLLWDSESGLEYVIYKNGKEVARVRSNVFIDAIPEEETLYEVRSLNRFGVLSEPAGAIYSP